MKNTKTNNNFNIEPLVLEIQNVLDNGLKKILKDYINKYNLLNETHKQIMMLPSVLNEINEKMYEKKEIHVLLDSESDSESEINSELSSTIKENYMFNNDESMFTRIKDMTKELVKDEVSGIKQEMEEMNKKFNSFINIVSCMSLKIEKLNDDIKILKENTNVEIISEKYIKPFIVTSCENENIKFEIKEENVYNKSYDELDNKKDENITGTRLKIEELEEEEEELEEQLEDQLEEEQLEEDQLEEEEEEQLEEQLEEDQLEEEEQMEEQLEEDEIETEATSEDEKSISTKELQEEEEELVEIEIDDVTYCTNDEENGFIYELTEEGEVGDKIGYLKEGEPFFYADEK
jgi:hypothetical protein